MSEIPLSSITDLLFVYGTLMQGYQNEFANYLHKHSFLVGDGCFHGRLYQVDWFPGAVYDSSAQTRVWGEVYQLQRPADTLTLLDQYEGIGDDSALFNRHRIAVDTGNQTVLCQVYLYALPTANLAQIGSGRFRRVS